MTMKSRNPLTFLCSRKYVILEHSYNSWTVHYAVFLISLIDIMLNSWLSQTGCELGIHVIYKATVEQPFLTQVTPWSVSSKLSSTTLYFRTTFQSCYYGSYPFFHSRGPYAKTQNVATYNVTPCSDLACVWLCRMGDNTLPNVSCTYVNGVAVAKIGRLQVCK